MKAITVLFFLLGSPALATDYLKCQAIQKAYDPVFDRVNTRILLSLPRACKKTEEECKAEAVEYIKTQAPIMQQMGRDWKAAGCPGRLLPTPGRNRK